MWSWYQMIDVGENYGCLDLDRSFIYFLHCILCFVHMFYNMILTNYQNHTADQATRTS